MRIGDLIHSERAIGKPIEEDFWVIVGLVAECGPSPRRRDIQRENHSSDRHQVAADDEVQRSEEIPAEDLDVGPGTLREHDGDRHQKPHGRRDCEGVGQVAG